MTPFDEAMETHDAICIENKKYELIGSSPYRLLERQGAIEIGWTFLAREYWGGAYNKEIKSLQITKLIES